MADEKEGHMTNGNINVDLPEKEIDDYDESGEFIFFTVYKLQCLKLA